MQTMTNVSEPLIAMPSRSIARKLAVRIVNSENNISQPACDTGCLCGNGTPNRQLDDCSYA